MQALKDLYQEYFKILHQAVFDETDLDYSILDKHKPLLQLLSEIGNSGITVFDMFQKKHVFTSFNYSTLLGYDLVEVERIGSPYFDAKIHPDDFVQLTRNGITVLKFYDTLTTSEKPFYKLVNEYRILNSDNKYVRVIEQHQVLELAKNGNIWLALSIIDVSPNQEDWQGVKSQIINFKEGKILPFPIEKQSTNQTLSNREKVVLMLVKEGLLSKEISKKLSISVHTVNTHRQRILEKLGVDNSLEAIKMALKLGLLQ